jgi:putative ABC transport system permease protein
VRTALDATPLDIVRLVLRQGGVMVISGLMLGFVVAAGTSRFLSGFLFGVTESDPATYVIVGVVLALVACAIPARRAARIDAITALRK